MHCQLYGNSSCPVYLVRFVQIKKTRPHNTLQCQGSVHLLFIVDSFIYQRIVDEQLFLYGSAQSLYLIY